MRDRENIAKTIRWEFRGGGGAEVDVHQPSGRNENASQKGSGGPLFVRRRNDPGRQIVSEGNGNAILPLILILFKTHCCAGSPVITRDN